LVFIEAGNAWHEAILCQPGAAGARIGRTPSPQGGRAFAGVVWTLRGNYLLKARMAVASSS
jgi:hypothetical protein